MLEAKLFEVTCFPCGIRERYEEETEANMEAYNHEISITHSTSSGYFVNVNEI
jgi:hypothetical protein